MKGYKKFLVGQGKTVSVDKVFTQTEFAMTELGLSVWDEAFKKLGDLMCLHMKTSFRQLTPKLMKKRLHSMCSIHLTLKTCIE